MASDRSFPPSARRLALARAAGLTPASPIVVGAIACVAAVVAVASLGTAIADRMGAWIRSAIGAADGSVLDSAHAAGLDAAHATGLDAAQLAGVDAAQSGLDAAHAAGLDAAHAGLDAAHAGLDAAHAAATSLANARELVSATIALALPVLGAIAIAAVLAQLAQTRAVWIPRRRIPNAPVEDPQRGTRGALAIGNAIVIALVAVGWLYTMAPRIAALTLSPRAGGVLVVSFVAALAIAWVVLGAIDALVRFAAHTHSLRMTPEEQRADQRLAGADPRWRVRRDKLARGEPVRDAVAGASVLVLGDGVAVAIAWDPVRRPVPVRTASGRAARATQLLGLSRRFAIAVHRDAELATVLATGEGPVPEAHWPRLAEIIAATRNRR